MMQVQLVDNPLVIPTGGGLGAEIRAVDLRRLHDGAFAAIHRAWLDHLVLLFRGQQLTDSELIRELGDTVLRIDRAAVVGRRPVDLHASRPAVHGKLIEQVRHRPRTRALRHLCLH
jgi:alpha-ketoglutarate-dependent taurine dioxygenase